MGFNSAFKGLNPSHVLYSQFQITHRNIPKICKATECHIWGILEDPVIDRPTETDELDYKSLKTGTETGSGGALCL